MFNNIFRNKIFALIVSIFFISTVSCKEKEISKDAENKVRPPVLTVTTHNVGMKSITSFINVSGTISPWDLISVQPSINGIKVVDIYVDTGDMVKKGQVLAVLDDSMLKAQLMALEAQLSNSLAQFAKMKKPNRKQEIIRQKAALEQAESNLRNAKANAQRFQDLYSQGAVSKAELDARTTSFETSEAMAKQEQQRLSLVLEGSREEDISIAESSVDNVRAQIEQLKVQLRYTKIVSQVDGRILDRIVHLGDLASTAGKFFTIIRDNKLELQAKTPEADLQFIHLGEQVDVTSDANHDVKTTGIVRQILPGIDPVSRQATIKISLKNVEGLYSGQFVKGTLNTGDKMKLVVPSKAIINTDGLERVFIVKNNIVTSKSIKIGSRNGDYSEVKAGLTEKDEIIIDGGGFLRDGDTVKIAKAFKN